MELNRNKMRIDRAVVKLCYEYDNSSRTYFRFKEKLTNIWCENLCKYAVDNYRYCGTSYTVCYCRETELSATGKRQNKCKTPCPGKKQETCGMINSREQPTHVTVSEIEKSTETVTVKNTQATIATSVSIKDSTTADFMNMITSATSPVTVTKSSLYTNQGIYSTSSENANTAISNVMTQTSTNATKGMRPKKLLCKCPKRLINTKWHFLDGKNIPDAEVKKMVLEDFNTNIKSEISVDKKTVSKEVRKKHSSVNKRKSSQSIGWGCFVFLILPMVFLIAIDILNCCIHFRTHFGGRKRNRIRPISNTQDQRDSPKSVQENVNVNESYYASRCGNNFHPDEMKRETYQRRRDDNFQQSRDEWLQYI
ncbi:unnamed protein product [Mytilus coruscus]|uniref:WSC domain-containing protein n=1 Tax=Mytilus coruscus TaxID=42192 RepID=A0A6J8CWQ0_MYTCO|nr:unnamed protein product [Mytilus coruscus]